MKVEFDIEPHLFEALVETSLGRSEDPMKPKFYFGREGVTVNAISIGMTMAFRGEYRKPWFAKYEVEEEGEIMLPSVIRQLVPNLKRAEVLHVSVNEGEINVNADNRKLSLKLPELEDTKEFPFSEYDSFFALPEKEMERASIISMGLDNWESMPGKGKLYKVRIEEGVFVEVEDDSGMWKFVKKVVGCKHSATQQGGFGSSKTGGLCDGYHEAAPLEGSGNICFRCTLRRFEQGCKERSVQGWVHLHKRG